LTNLLFKTKILQNQLPVLNDCFGRNTCKPNAQKPEIEPTETAKRPSLQKENAAGFMIQIGVYSDAANAAQ
jgi:hypothetical protein